MRFIVARLCWLLRYEGIERGCEFDPREAPRGVEGVAVEGKKAALQSDGDVASPRERYRRGVGDGQRKRSGGGLRFEAGSSDERDRCREFRGSVEWIEVPAERRIIKQ